MKKRNIMLRFSFLFFYAVLDKNVDNNERKLLDIYTINRKKC